MTDEQHPGSPAPTDQGAGLLGASHLREIAARLGIRPTKQWGQNFVVDANTVRRIVRTAEVGEADTVVEVGPGLGSLTLAILEKAGHVVAVEVDPVLAAVAGVVFPILAALNLWYQRVMAPRAQLTQELRSEVLRKNPYRCPGTDYQVPDPYYCSHQNEPFRTPAPNRERSSAPIPEPAPAPVPSSSRPSTAAPSAEPEPSPAPSSEPESTLPELQA